jgi:diguanylate cyclase (GGDEF)-like protein
MDDNEYGMVAAALAALRRAAETEGVGIIGADGNQPHMLLESGFGGPNVLRAVWSLLSRDSTGPSHAVAADARPVLVHPWSVPRNRSAGLAMWRAPNARPWTAQDHTMVSVAAGVLRTMLEHGPGELGLDRLTTLPNRAYFLDEVDRHIDRLDLDRIVGTMIFVDLDDLHRVNAQFGRQSGDRTLISVANMLRAMARPADVVGRVGGDEFAVWCDGMDHMTAAERSDALGQRRVRVTDTENLTTQIRQTLSIGIASRQPGSIEDARTLLRRAHMAAYEVKIGGGGGGWRVSTAPPFAR